MDKIYTDKIYKNKHMNTFEHNGKMYYGTETKEEWMRKRKEMWKRANKKRFIKFLREAAQKKEKEENESIRNNE